jgi:hypothetical protein
MISIVEGKILSGLIDPVVRVFPIKKQKHKRLL